jgi:hypothetical protein
MKAMLVRDGAARSRHSGRGHRLDLGGQRDNSKTGPGATESRDP